MNACSGLFAKLEDAIKNTDPRAARLLRPGLSAANIKRKLRSLPFSVSADVISLYEWADGAEDPFDLLPGAHFVPLASAIRASKTISALNSEYPQKYGECLRFLSDGSDGGYGFGRLDSPSKGRIVNLCIHADWMLGFENLAQVLKTATACYRKKSTQPGSDCIDFDAYFKLAGKLNPKFKVWKS